MTRCGHLFWCVYHIPACTCRHALHASHLGASRCCLLLACCCSLPSSTSSSFSSSHHNHNHNHLLLPPQAPPSFFLFPLILSLLLHPPPSSPTSFVMFNNSWPCLHEWLQRKPECPVCKAGTTRDSVIPLYTTSNKTDPRFVRSSAGQQTNVGK